MARVFATVVVFLTLLALPASAQSRSSQARDHVRAGMAYAERGKWEDALHEFEEAYALEPQALRLYDVAQARFKTNRFRAAAEAYAKLEADASLSPEQHERVKIGLASAREKIAHVQVAVPNARAGDILTIDGAAVARDTNVDLDPGRHIARLVRDGEVSESTLELDPGAMITVTLVGKSREAVRPPPPPAPLEEKKGVPTMTWVLAGTAVATLATGTYFGLVGLHKYNRIQDDPCAESKTCGRRETSSMVTHLVVGDVLIGVGVVAAGAALYLWLRNSSDTNAKKSAFDPGSLTLSF